jgi:hypothetical protein
VKVWDAARGTASRQLDGAGGTLFAVSVDGHRILAAGKDSAPTKWDSRSEPIVPASATLPGK